MVGKGAHADKFTRLRKLDCAAPCPRVRSRMGKTCRRLDRGSPSMPRPGARDASESQGPCNKSVLSFLCCVPVLQHMARVAWQFTADDLAFRSLHSRSRNDKKHPCRRRDHQAVRPQRGSQERHAVARARGSPRHLRRERRGQEHAGQDLHRRASGRRRRRPRRRQADRNPRARSTRRSSASRWWRRS